MCLGPISIPLRPRSTIQQNSCNKLQQGSKQGATRLFQVLYSLIAISMYTEKYFSKSTSINSSTQHLYVELEINTSTVICTSVRVQLHFVLVF